MQTTVYEDCLIVFALVRLSYEFEEADKSVSNEAWNLAIAISAAHDFTPEEAVRHV